MDLSLYKVREDLDDGDWGLRSIAAAYKPLDTRKLPGIDSIQLFLGQSVEQPPKWQKDLLAVTTHAQLKDLNNKTTAALMLIRHRGHRFILSFGGGWHAIDVNSIQQSFGLRVAANVIGPTELKGASTRSLTRRGRSQSVSINPGSLHALGIETSEELVRQLSGKPPREFAHDVAGGDMLRLKLPDFSFSDLAYKLDEILALEQSEDYKEHFGFLDYFVRVPRSNKKLYAELNERLSRLFAADPDSVGFACPELDEDYPADYSRFVAEIVSRLSRNLIRGRSVKSLIPGQQRILGHRFELNL